MRSRLAVIDLGTNSVRFDVHELSSTGEPRLLHREKLMVRLGENLFTGGRLDRNAVRRTLQAMTCFSRTARELLASRTIAFGTSALREARDTREFLREIRQATGIEVQVISGEEEASLIAEAVLRYERNREGTFALVDIGGGSTEISICRNGRALFSHSFELGVARLHQLFLKTTPPAPASSSAVDSSIDELRAHIQSVLMPTLTIDGWPRTDEIIGSSGTVKALAKIIRKTFGTPHLERGLLRKLVKRMSRLKTNQLLAIPGMEPKRVDLIVAGGVVLEEVMDALGALRVIATDYSLRDGILDRELVLLRGEKRRPAVPHWDSLIAQAARFGEERVVLRRRMERARMLYRRLRGLHRLGLEWENHFVLASLFRDTGKAISPINFETHSYYIAKHADLPLAENWETDFVARLILHYDSGSYIDENLDWSPSSRRAFVKLLALFRVLGAMEPPSRLASLPSRIQVGRREVNLRLARGRWAELARLRLHSRKDLFEEVFGRELTTGNC